MTENLQKILLERLVVDFDFVDLPCGPPICYLAFASKACVI